MVRHSLDQSHRTSDELGKQAPSGGPRLERDNHGMAHRRFNRTWAEDAREGSLTDPERHTPTNPEAPVSRESVGLRCTSARDLETAPDNPPPD